MITFETELHVQFFKFNYSIEEQTDPALNQICNLSKMALRLLIFRVVTRVPIKS